ncbi:MAG TPA: OmpA family protein [Bryobacteraceae bacterium]|nr:OmpA family protein [Bryobacteraceae bacterium]HOL72027.1 OmpA family protein [Bryobacteraceae bacterium]HOQ46721.1 OmpA family protein [Bryobacteraceae bacterium]HPQ15294.1 OmpA family protein [Bryobacteraceae bacterium]HPU72391.1 OmpA family protein [Bryobacteraceae bacterium]
METGDQRDRSKSRWRLLGAAAAIAAIAILSALLWQAANRLKTVEERLSRADERSQAVISRLTEYSRELELALERAQEARRRAEEAEAARSEAVSEAERVQSEAERARAEAQAAQQRAQAAQRQMEELRRRREQELDRMQEALSRIAPTRRTPLGMVVEMANDSFKFDFDQATLRPENRETLSRIAGVLLASSGYRLFVYGHTDDIGTDEYNQQLSLRRAQAVADYLIKAGVPADIMTTKGFGKSSPRVKGTTPEARQQNRRVEIGIVDTIIQYEGAPAHGR